MSENYYRVMAQGQLADDLARLAAAYSDFARDLDILLAYGLDLERQRHVEVEVDVVVDVILFPGPANDRERTRVLAFHREEARARCRDLAHDIDRARNLDLRRALNLGRDLDRILDRARGVVCDVDVDRGYEHVLHRALDDSRRRRVDPRHIVRDLDPELIRACAGIVARTPDLKLASASASDLAGRLNFQASVLRAAPLRDNLLDQADSFATAVLTCLACFFPADERSRFVAEAHGNLGDCGHWRQRVDLLVRLALGTPRLAWMMWREGRRGRL
jgi:hypothetical protein